MINLEGMYDLHIHPAPSPQKRRFSALEAVKLASEVRMAGVLFLDHTYNTTPMAHTINEMNFRTKAFGTIMLNEAVGGLNPSVVEIALRLGTRQIQMPTYSSKAHFDAYGDDQSIFPYKKRLKPMYLLDDAGHLIAEVEEILELMKGTDAFLGTGHISPLEIDALVRRAKELKIRVAVNSVSTDMPGIPLADQRKWADEDIFMEHDFMALTDVPHHPAAVADVVKQIREVGAKRCVLGTDSGTVRLPDNIAAMEAFVSRLLDAGLTEKEIDVMTKRNPSIVLGIT
jgi:hypothetical protein